MFFELVGSKREGVGIINILIEGEKCKLKLEPRVLKRMNMGEITLDDVIDTLTQNDDVLARIEDNTFHLENRAATISGMKYGNTIVVEFAGGPLKVRESMQ